MVIIKIGINSMTSSAGVQKTFVYVAIAIVTFFVLQSVTIVMHEFIHSTTAWLLGYTPSPL
jgi:hypothetical protein